MTHLLFALGTLIVSAAYAHAVPDKYPKNPAVDVLHYRFQLELSDKTSVIRGEASIDVRFLAAGLTRLRFDLIKSSVDQQGQGMSVISVDVNDDPVSFVHEEDTLLVSLATPSSMRQRIRIAVRYQGVPATGLVIGPNKYGDRTFFSDNWPNKARHWLPTVDHPYDKATCEFVVTAPAHYQVVSNGLKIEATDLSDGRRLTHWKQSVPIATWLFALGVARFAVQHVDDYEGKSIQTWVYYQDREAGFHDFAVPTRRVLEFFGSYVGPYSYEKLANVQANSVGGGMEAATAIFYGDNSVTGNRSIRWRNVVIHEIAHQWFGNSVTEYDWDDVWLSEGFATYFTLLFIEHAYGRDEFLSGLASSRARVLRFHEENPDYPIVHDNLTDMFQVTSSQTYQKGSWVLHMLRGVIGTEAFWRGIRAYYKEHRDGNATTADFRRAMEEASGIDLEQFFHQWLYRGGILRLKGGWKYEAESSAIEISLRQVEDGGSLFDMPIEIGIGLENGEWQIEHLSVSSDPDSVSSLTISVDREPTSVVLDPNSWVLMQANFVRQESR